MEQPPQDPIAVLRKYWGYDRFRPFQEDIIRSVLEGRDTVALLPTGGGKSLCYQVPALCNPGLCVVISPLIALMEDQVRRLRDLNIDAAALHSGMHSREVDLVLSNARFGQLKLLYMAPERLTTARMQEYLRILDIRFYAIDEAHCIAQWGHDFRPSYLNIAQCRDWSPKANFLALTATATPETRHEIASQLQLRDPRWFEMSFRRANLSIVVREEENKRDFMLHLLRKIRACSLVYVRNRKLTETLSQFLKQRGLAAEAYHAGLEPSVRSERQERWISGKTPVMVATNAFGMGIDKADVRLVHHLDLPPGLEEYFQEIGRAGRDQQAAYAVLCYTRGDATRLREEWELQFPTLEELREIYKLLAVHLQIATGVEMEESVDFDVSAFCARFHIKPAKVLPALRILEQSGKIVVSDALYRPSRIHFIASDEDLRQAMSGDPGVESLIKTMLRSYEGIFHYAVPIDEYQLARGLSTPVESLLFTLRKLQAEGLLRYQEAKTRPQLLFLGERERSSDLMIDKAWYDRRKALLKARMEGMLRFVETDQCRQVFISTYFGQQEPEPCGMCDNCRMARQAVADAGTLAKWRTAIMRQILEKGSCSLREILYRFPINRRPEIESLVENLVAEGTLRRHWDILSLNDSAKP